MPLDFPSSPTLNQTYAIGVRTWKWNGNAWELLGNNSGYSGYSGASGISGFSGAVFPGGNVTVALNISNSASSTSTTTGALIVSGGTGIGGNLHVGGSFTGRMKNYSLETNALGNISGNTTVNLTLGNYVTGNVTGLVTWTFSNATTSPNASGFILELTNGGSATQEWPGSVKWPSGTAPSLTATGVDVLSFITDDGGNTWRGVASMIDSK